MLCLLDTNAVTLAIGQGRNDVRAQYQAMLLEHTPAISVVVEAELRFGLARRPLKQALRHLIEEWLDSTVILPWESNAAAEYARLRTYLEQAGTPLHELDMMIAAHALALDAMLVTRDQAFRHVPMLRLEHW